MLTSVPGWNYPCDYFSEVKRLPEWHRTGASTDEETITVNAHQTRWMFAWFGNICSENVSTPRMHTFLPPSKGKGRTFGITLIESDVLTLHRNISPDATECTISRSINLLRSQSSFSKVRKELSEAWLAVIYNTHKFWVDCRTLPFLFFPGRFLFS